MSDVCRRSNAPQTRRPIQAFAQARFEISVRTGNLTAQQQTLDPFLADQFAESLAQHAAYGRKGLPGGRIPLSGHAAQVGHRKRRPGILSRYLAVES